MLAFTIFHAHTSLHPSIHAYMGNNTFMHTTRGTTGCLVGHHAAVEMIEQTVRHFDLEGLQQLQH